MLKRIELSAGAEETQRTAILRRAIHASLNYTGLTVKRKRIAT